MPFISADRPVLVTQAHLTRFAGSEMVVLELVEHLTSRGIRVIVVTHVLGNDIEVELKASKLVDVFLSDDPAVDARLIADPPAYAWIQHQLIPRALLTGAISCPVVFVHLSAQLSIEFPLSPSVEATLGTVIAFNSEETLAQQRDSGILSAFDSERTVVLGNPAPDAFAALPLTSARQACGVEKPRLLVVSNHIPDELVGAVDMLGDQFEVRLVGRQREKGAEPERVRPETIQAADAVVSIGKTVQYALMAGRPVYCYDHFGGPGWLDDDNFEAVRVRNFSGRGFTPRSAGQIAQELADGIDAAREWASERRAKAVAEFSLAARIADIERRLRAWTPLQIGVPTLDALAFVKQGELIRRFVNMEARSRHLLRERSVSLDRMTASRDASREHAKEVEALLDRTKERAKSLEADRSHFLSERVRVSRQRDALIVERDSLKVELDKARSGIVWRATETMKRFVGSVERSATDRVPKIIRYTCRKE